MINLAIRKRMDYLQTTYFSFFRSLYFIFLIAIPVDAASAPDTEVKHASPCTNKTEPINNRQKNLNNLEDKKKYSTKIEKKTQEKETPRPKKETFPEKKELVPQKYPATLQENSSSKKTASITNAIDEAMLTYKYGFVSYRPSKFTVKINDQIITPGQTKPIIIEQNSFVATYNYEFLDGLRVGTKKVTFKIDKIPDQLEVKFSWHDKYHVLIEGAQPVSIEVV